MRIDVDHYAGRILALVGQTNVKREDMRNQLCDLIREIQAHTATNVAALQRALARVQGEHAAVCRCNEYETCPVCVASRTVGLNMNTETDRDKP